MEAQLIAFFIQYPFTIAFISAVGVFRLFFKPIMAAIHSYVESTPSKEDDEKLKKIEESKWYKVAMFVIDYLLSIKLPEKKSQ